MHTSQWNRERFKDVLEEIQKRTNLTQADLAKFAGRNRTQINRWVRAENQPGYAALRSLASATAARYPDLTPLARELMEAAGYDAALDTEEIERTAEAKAAVPQPPTPGPDIPAIEAEIAHLEAGMTPEQRTQYERAVREEEEDYERRLRRRKLIYAKLMRGEPIDKSDVHP